LAAGRSALGLSVVVEEASDRIGERLAVTVTGALQTPTGRMVFARCDRSPERPGERGNGRAADKQGGKPVALQEHQPPGPG
jgi:hypothetical protein